MKHLTVRVSDSLYKRLAFLMEKWEANQSQTLRLCIIYQSFAEEGNETLKNYIQEVALMKEALENGSD